MVSSVTEGPSFDRVYCPPDYTILHLQNAKTKKAWFFSVIHLRKRHENASLWEDPGYGLVKQQSLLLQALLLHQQHLQEKQYLSPYGIRYDSPSNNLKPFLLHPTISTLFPIIS